MRRALAAAALCAACGPAPGPGAPITNVPAPPSGELAAPVVGEHVTIRAAGVSVHGARGGPPLALVEPPASTRWLFTLPVIEAAPDAIRVRIEYTDEELWLWIDGAAVYPVIRVAQPVTRAGAHLRPADAGVWVTPGVPVELSGPMATASIAIGYPPPDTANGDDFSLRFTGFVTRGTIARSFVPARGASRFPPWARRLVARGLAAEVIQATTILDAPGGAPIADLFPVAPLAVTVLEVRDGHRRVAVDTGEIGVVGWISEGAFLSTPASPTGSTALRTKATTVPAGTCLYDEAGQAIGRFNRDARMRLDDQHRGLQPTPWGFVSVHLEPAPGGWRTCGEGLTSGG